MAMKLTATKSQGGDYEYPEPGNQVAVLVGIIDLGTVKKNFKGQEYDAREVLFVWELTTQQMTGSTFNHVVGLSYTLSFGEKSNLRKMVAKWRGKPFAEGEEIDISVMLGKSCLLDVQPSGKEDKKYVKLDPLCAAQLPKGTTCPAAKRKPVMWEIEGNDQLPEHLDWLPWLYIETVQDRIKRSNEWRKKLDPAQKAGANGSAGKDEGVISEESPEEVPF